MDLSAIIRVLFIAGSSVAATPLILGRHLASWWWKTRRAELGVEGMMIHGAICWPLPRRSRPGIADAGALFARQLGALRWPVVCIFTQVMLANQGGVRGWALLLVRFWVSLHCSGRANVG